MTMSDTPRTDAGSQTCEDGSSEWCGEWVPADFSRQLERELAAANARVKELEVYAERLESTGNSLAIWAPREPWRKLWADAKDAKP